MNTTQLKSFTAEARKSLLSGVKSKMNALGFKDNGTVDERDYPMQAPDGTLFQGEIYDVSFYGKWMRLKDEIARYGFRQVCEEGAYTWFNRLMAIQILSRNGLIDPVLEFESPDVRIPLMVKQAHEGIRPEMTAFDATCLNAVIDDDNRITDQFAILIVAYCQSTPILYKCFGTLNDFTELLLPTNILASNGFLNLLNGSTFITQDDYKTTELIGWLYQFYISERKDVVFASFKKGQKANAEDIPAATQIFTPNWIVKYMVQNTLGRIYLDNNPDSTLKDSWQYLVAAPEPVEGSPSERGQGGVLQLSSLEDYTFADLSCGSGHILGEAFDLLYAIYIEEGYTRRQAIKAIFQRNLLGIDIDTRAKQLATFTLMLKACQQWGDAINCEVMPRVLDMSGLTPPNYENLTDTLPHFFLGSTAKTKAETIAAINLMQQAANLGSIMKFDISPETRAAIVESMKRWEDEGLEDFEGLFPAMRLILALTDKYAAIAMNPPYMGNHNMNRELKEYVDQNYPLTNNDLGSVFMEVAEHLTAFNGKYSMINQAAWMLKPAYKQYRVNLINERPISLESLIYLGAGTFEELKGEVVQSAAFVFSNSCSNAKATFYKLTKYKTTSEKEAAFIQERANFYKKSVKEFSAFSGSQFGFWINELVIKALEKSELSSYGRAKQGLKTGDNPYFIRLWHEINFQELNKKWFPLENGGDFRKWYGNHDSVILWENDGYELKNFRNEAGRLRSRPQGLDFAFREGITWSTSAAEKPSFRFSDDRFLFESSGSKFCLKDNSHEHLLKICSFFNSYVSKNLLEVFSPGLGVSEGAINSLPYIEDERINIANVQTCIDISKQDWNAHEISWDFKEYELVRIFKEGKAKDLQATISAYKEEWEEKFNQLHNNEEELNRQFIGIYGLEDELSPEVPLEEVTILQQGEISIEDK